MSLAWTAPTKANMEELMYTLIYYKFEDNTTLWDAWAATAASGTADEQAAAVKFGGRTLTVHFSMEQLALMPQDPNQANQFEFITFQSGICLEDYSSGMGGVCFLEDNDTVSNYGTTPLRSAWTNVVGDDRTTTATEGSRTMKTYRPNKATLATFPDLWNTVTPPTPAANPQDPQSGRIYYEAIKTDVVATSAPQIEYLDYAFCELDNPASGAPGAYTNLHGWWTCQLYLPKREKQTAGYPAFDVPGVWTATYISSHIADTVDLSRLYMTDFIQSDFATATTYSAAILATVYTLLF